MSHYLKLAATLTTGTLLGCTQVPMTTSQGSPADLASRQLAAAMPRIEPVQRITSPVSEAQAAYLMGRSAHGSGQLAQAEAAYAKVLEANPSHVGALSSLAVIYAQTERFDKSFGLFDQALALEPGAAHIHNNRGYALLLAGRLPQAEEAFKVALGLNPSSAMVQKNRELLAQAKAKAPAATVATAVAKEASLNQDTLSSFPRRRESSPTESLDPHLRGNDDAKGPTLVSLGQQIYELRDSPVVAQAESPVTLKLSTAVSPHIAIPPTEVPPTYASLQGVKIEVSNGVGIRNLARRTADRLAPMGVVTARLTNQPGYKQTKTEIFYSAGQMGAAQALSAKLPMAAKVLAANDLGTRVQMRLVLGRDVDVKALANWLDGLDAPVLALNRFEGWLWS